MNVVAEEALTIARGDEELARAILSGAVLLSRFPKYLRAPDAEEGRLAWMREQKARHHQRLEELFGDLLIDVKR